MYCIMMTVTQMKVVGVVDMGIVIMMMMMQVVMV